MEHKSLNIANLKGRQIYQVGKVRSKPLIALQSTAINTKETKRRATSTINHANHTGHTKKQVLLCSSSHLADNDHSIPYSVDLINHLKTIEREFFTYCNCKELTYYSLCRLRYISRLKNAKIEFNLLEETVFLAIHIYDKYFQLEKERLRRLSKIKYDREQFSVSKFLYTERELTRRCFWSEVQGDGRYRNNCYIYSKQVPRDIPAGSGMPSQILQLRSRSCYRTGSRDPRNLRLQYTANSGAISYRHYQGRTRHQSVFGFRKA